MARLRRDLETNDLIPDLESTRTLPAVVLHLEPVPTWTEVLADWDRQEALSVTLNWLRSSSAVMGFVAIADDAEGR